MEEKLDRLFKECIQELEKIGIDINNKDIGKIEINISKRNNKRYGACKQEEPDIKSKYIEKIGRRKIVKYWKYNKHIIEISKWVMELVKIRKDVKIDVIAFNVTEADDLDQLECTSLVTGGKFYSANTAAELARSLNNSINVKKDVEAKIIPHK